MNSSNEAPKTILIVEDDTSIREILQEALEAEGFKVVQAVNGKDGLEKLSMFPEVSLVLLDMMMPVMNGREFLDYLHGDEILKQIPVIVVSANASPAQAKGSRGFIPKPIDFDYLVKMIKRFQTDDASAI